MGWIYLAVAIGFEIVGTTAMKLSDGMTRPWPAVAVVLCYGVSFTLLAWALRSLEVGVAYAVWSAVGTMAIAAIGILVFGEGAGVMKLLGIALIVAGVISLRLSDGRV